MTDKTLSPLQVGFWLTRQEQHYLLFICALAFIGFAAQLYYQPHEKSTENTVDGVIVEEGPIHE